MNNKINLSKEQKTAVDFRGSDLLVSAAAGSGKTAVLVERIIQRILGCPDENGTRTKEPAQIDRFLIVTFTNAAAAQMKEKIEKKLDEVLEAGEIDDEMRSHLEQQTVLVHHAQISTLHSFCSRIIKEHFQDIGLDPSYRMGDDTEMLLLKNDVLGNVIEKAYKGAEESEEDRDFYHFVENYCTGKNDNALENIILDIYEKVMSHPWPKEWLDLSLREPSVEDVDYYFEIVLNTTLEWVKSIISSCSRALKICEMPGGPEEYKPAILSDRDGIFEPVKAVIEKFMEEGNKRPEGKGPEKIKDVYKKVRDIFMDAGFERLKNRKKDTDEEMAAQAKSIRDNCKTQFLKLKEMYFTKSYDEVIKEEENTYPILIVLKKLVLVFMDELDKEKRRKKILDFNDLEHLALNILVEDGDDKAPSAAAIEYRDSFVEIMVDEYQDSNEIQEVILKSISDNNMFMVGDVKQSIYRFRMAKPELFERKHESFFPLNDNENTGNDNTGNEDVRNENTSDGGRAAGCFVELSNNYRSRDLVIDSVNEIFKGIMEKKVGNIDYTKDVQLNYRGREFKEYKEFPGKTECIIGDCGSGDDAVETEAHMVAKRISDMLEAGETIADDETGEFRPVKPGDIVILLRSMKNISDVFLNVLNSYGIPALCETREGYFQTEEIKTALNFLKIIDNPRQDIPLTAVMASPVFGFSEQEFALIKIKGREKEWYEAVRDYRNEGDFGPLREKCSEFMDTLGKWRRESLYMTVSELLEYVLEDSGYMDIMTVRKGGERRRENLKLLVEKAGDFEKTSFTGLFNFNRYIEKILEYEVDYGEAGTGRDYENSVTIMSIHKSKGLEYPVVFVSGLGRKFNYGDERTPILFHSEMGLGTDFLNEKTRIKKTTLKKKLIQNDIKSETMGEEIRVLYVAFTRAKERLILTGCVRDAGKKAEAWSMAKNSFTDNGERSFISYYDRLYAGNRLDLIMPVLYNIKDNGLQRSPGSEDYVPAEGIPGNGKEEKKVMDFETENFVVRYKNVKLVTFEESKLQETLYSREEDLRNLKNTVALSEEEFNNLNEIMYLPENIFAGLSGKVSVSEIKRRRLEGELGEEEETVPEILGNAKEAAPEILGDEKEAVPEEAENIGDAGNIPLPRFAQKKEEIKGAQRGTVFHKVMQYMDYETLDENSQKKDILDFLEDLVDHGRITREEMNLFIKSDRFGWMKIQNFLKTELAKRMKTAALHGGLYREYPFVLGVSPEEIYPETLKKIKVSSGELSDDKEKTQLQGPLILVQGIIDAYFYEGDDVVLVDYKTDRVNYKEKGQDLIKKYEVQMEYYKKALTRALGKSPKEIIIYSFGLDREIKIEIC